MGTTLRLAKHSTRPDTNVIEVWHGGEFVATITGSNSRGVCIISKFLPSAREFHADHRPGVPGVLEVNFATTTEPTKAR